MIKSKKSGFKFLTSYVWKSDITFEVYSVHGNSFAVCAICNGMLFERESSNINDATQLLISSLSDHLSK